MTKRKRRCKIRNVAIIMAISATFLILSSVLVPGGQGFLLFSHGASAPPYTVDIAKTDGSYSPLTDPSIKYSNYVDADAAFDGSASQDTVIRDSNGKVIAMKRGMVITQPTNATLTLNPISPGEKSAYVTSNVVTFYNKTSDDGTTVTFPIFGFTGSCNVSQVLLIPGAFVYDPGSAYGGTTTSTKWKFDSFTRDGQDLIHNLRRYDGTDTDYASITVDKAPTFMTQGVQYYSSDSLHYYTNPYDAAANNVSAAAGIHAIYYQWVSYRTKTSYTATQLDSYTALIKGSSSVYTGKAIDFITNQNLYGVNAAMEMAFANLESGYGTSKYAVERYNLFGIDAVDSNSDAADYFASISDCLKYHTSSVLSRGYFDGYSYINKSLPPSFYDVNDDTRDGTYYTGGSYNGDFRYFGAYPGNKYSGVNVKYASDPSHGEKIAGIMYKMDSYLGMQDYDRYSIGITNKATIAYALPNEASNQLYKIASQSTNHTSNYPVGMAVTILGVTGDYYQIISDMPLKAYTAGNVYACNVWNYNHAVSIAYVKRDSITLVRDNLNSGADGIRSSVYRVNNTSKNISGIWIDCDVADFKMGFANKTIRVYDGATEVTSGRMKTGMKIQAYNLAGNPLAVYTAVVTGDVNGDGIASIADLVQINRHLLKVTEIFGAGLAASDLNNSETVTIADLVKLNRVLLGLDAITPN